MFVFMLLDLTLALIQMSTQLVLPKNIQLQLDLEGNSLCPFVSLWVPSSWGDRIPFSFDLTRAIGAEFYMSGWLLHRS